jgi:hypothetical protein
LKISKANPPIQLLYVRGKWRDKEVAIKTFKQDDDKKPWTELGRTRNLKKYGYYTCINVLSNVSR